MKPVFLFFTICMLNLPGLIHAQNDKFTLSLKDTSIKQVLNHIELNSNYRFFYNDQYTDLEKKVTIEVWEMNIETILHQLFEKLSITYRIMKNNTVVIIPREVKQTITIIGKVVEDKGNPLPGVNVIVKGTTIGVVTGFNGEFSIEAPYAHAILVFSFVGYQAQEIALEGRTTIAVTLKEDIKALQEVVVVGFGTQTKTTVTGAISTITTRELKQSPTANLTNALVGRLPGLLINQFSGGEPGVDKSTLYVRGYSTYGDKSPIIIVDGVERDMTYLSPEEIETFTLLKDASATAPYGVRGANGVIIVTTKRGQAQEKATLNLKASFGLNTPVKFPRYLGSAEYAELYNEAMMNDNPGKQPNDLNLFSAGSIDNFRQAKGDNSDGLGYNWDYFDYAFKPGTQEDYSLSVSGGSSKIRYFVLANYFKQNGNYKHTDLSVYNTQSVFKRYNFRSNIDIDVTKNFYVRLDLGARITDRTAPGTTASRIVEICNTQPSYLPIIIESNGNPANVEDEINNPLGMLYGDQIYRYNLLGELCRTGFHNYRYTYLNGNFSLGYRLDFITNGLKVDGTFSYDAATGRKIGREVEGYSEGYRAYPGYATFVPSEGRDVYMTPGHYAGAYVTGNKYNIDQPMNNKMEHQDAEYRTYYQLKLNYAREFGKNDISTMVLFNRSIMSRNQEVQYCYQGLTGRITYNYGEQYLLELNAGYNGSENFAPGKRYGLFPAVSAGWIVSNEPFMERTKGWLNNLKIRGSFGLVGSDKIPNGKRFVYLQFFVTGNNYYFGDNYNSGQGEGIKEGDLSNPDLSWEKARKTNIGLDAVFFRNKLSVTIDVFREYRYDIITNLSEDGKAGFPTISGKSAPYINSGIVINKGVDFEIIWDHQVGNIRYYFRPNFTFARNRIEFMSEIERDFPWRAGTGKRIGEHFVYRVDHFVKDKTEADQLNAMNSNAGFQQWGSLTPGDVVYRDLNGDERIDDLGDRMAKGYPRDPEIQFSIPMGMRYKGFDFGMMFQGSTNTSILLSGPAVYDFPLFSNDKYGKVKPLHLNRWTPETTATATYPALHYADNPNNKNSNSDLFLYNASYLRLKSIEFGYNIPAEILRKINIQHLRVYLQGLNLFTWDKLGMVGIDPETMEGNGSWYPIQKVFNFGIEITI